MSTQTPMLKQYVEIKKEYPDSILFFRLGDFYEMFYDDAKVASKVLGIALTSRNKSGKNPVPLCGVPHHSAEPYLAKLLKAGHKVAVCEQVEDPKTAKGVVKRKVVRVLTPGAIIDTEKLDSKSNNYLASVYVNNSSYGFAYTDISTGIFRTTSFSTLEALIDELAQIEPKELLLQDDDSRGDIPKAEFARSNNPLVTELDSWIWDMDRSKEVLLEHLSTKTLEPYGLEEHPDSISASGALIQYLKDTQMEEMPPLDEPSYYERSEYLLIDDSTKRNLELLKNIRGDSEQGTLFWVLDETMTAMGARLLKFWISNPLIKIKEIETRLDAVGEFKSKPRLKSDLRAVLKEISDIERLIGRISTSSARPRDLGALRDSSSHITEIKKKLEDADTKILKQIGVSIDDLSDIRNVLENVLLDELPVSARDGGIIKEGVNSELDDLRLIRRDGKKWIAELESKERESSGISSLKIGYNKVFGYYIEVTKTHLASVPENYIRKQTLVNAERYITQDLKDYEERLLGAEDKILDIEREVFEEIRAKVANESERIRRTASLLATIDVFCSLSEVAEKYDYVRPKISNNRSLELKDNRHPVIERMDLGERFVPNDIKLDTKENQVLIITGPNMAGKSTLIRQVALSVLMAQMGSFVPAAHAQIGLSDRIFTRVGASDNLAKGHSTFMVEMVETAYILRHATDKSLVILDEIGRGTSTFDGMSIAWAVAEYLHDLGSRTLFATHYHELAELAVSKKRVNNYNIYVKDNGDKIVFLRKLIPGATSHSYGIQVAKLAGVPEQVIKSARKVLLNLEKSQTQLRDSILGGQVSLFDDAKSEAVSNDHPLLEEIKELDTNSITPLDALTKLAELKKKLEED
ncbi:MAG: DNA mismatch repair protein MutS [Thermodesulfobacteriota bacterium]|nr:MAG: DNA mismatch repair protein MutS [Thermodesulfobacteriota bacterium]